LTPNGRLEKRTCREVRFVPLDLYGAFSVKPDFNVMFL